MNEIDASQTVACFSMEIGLKSNLPTCGDGLGMLAGDTIRSSADMGVSPAAVTMLHRKGYLQNA
jgi:starch phosphorylase